MAPHGLHCRMPFQILKDQYISHFGGWTPELCTDEIGLNKGHLHKTNIAPYVSKVTIRVMDRGSRLPLFFKKLFTVVPLGRETPDALSKSPLGEVVLPEDGRKSKEYSRLKEGDLLILNNILDRQMDEPAHWPVDFLKRYYSQSFFR